MGVTNSNMVDVIYSTMVLSVTKSNIFHEANSNIRHRKTVTTASKLRGITLPSMEYIYSDRMMKKANNIVGDERHPLPPHLNFCHHGDGIALPFH